MREYLVRTLAPKILVSEKIIDTVVAYQFSEANAAMLTNDSIEISGFGKMLFNKKKAIKKMEKFLSQKALFESILEDVNAPELKKHKAEDNRKYRERKKAENEEKKKSEDRAIRLNEVKQKLNNQKQEADEKYKYMSGYIKEMMNTKKDTTFI
jgi:nucleoid DNA-binding protein